MEIRLPDKGRVQVPALGLDLVANGPTEDEARGCIAHQRRTQPRRHRDADSRRRRRRGWEQFCTQAGAIRADKTVPRDSDDPEATSVLPDPDRVYVTETANTAEDLAELAPKVTVEVAEQIEAADPTLDTDLADWWADSCIRPRLRVLGPIKVRIGVGGSAKAATNRKPACNNAVAYLSTRPRGATTQEVADALSITDDRVRQDISIVRAWLGGNRAPAGSSCPAPPNTARGGTASGAPPHRDLLCDADLFKRLRLRAKPADPKASTTCAPRFGWSTVPRTTGSAPAAPSGSPPTRSITTCCAASSTPPTSSPPSPSRPATSKGPAQPPNSPSSSPQEMSTHRWTREDRGENR